MEGGIVPDQSAETLLRRLVVSVAAALHEASHTRGGRNGWIRTALDVGAHVSLEERQLAIFDAGPLELQHERRCRWNGHLSSDQVCEHCERYGDRALARRGLHLREVTSRDASLERADRGFDLVGAR